jgi:hypothetical protein
MPLKPFSNVDADGIRPTRARARIELLIRLCYHDHVRGVAQPGSVLDWGSSGREFKSRHLDQRKYVRDGILASAVFFFGEL